MHEEADWFPMKRYESRKKKQEQRLQSDKGNYFFDGKIPFPPHFPSKSGTCTMMPSHMRKIIWLSLFYACIFCGMWHDVTCPGDVNATFQIWFSLSTTSYFILLIHNPSLSPHQRYPAKTVVLMSLLSLKTQATLEHDINIFTQMLVCIILWSYLLNFYFIRMHHSVETV